MIYQRSHDIEQRLNEVLRLVRTGRFSTPQMAEKLGVSIPTISRCIESLRARGHAIRSVRRRDGWKYVLEKGNPVERGELNSPAAISREDQVDLTFA